MIRPSVFVSLGPHHERLATCRSAVGHDEPSLAREFLAAPVDSGLHRALWQGQLVRDLLIRQLLNVVQRDRHPQRIRQLGQRVMETGPAVAALEGHQRIRLTAGRRHLSGIDTAVDHLAFLANAPVVIDAEVAADTDQPGLKIGPAVEGAERLEDLQEYVLGQILRHVVPADELVGDVENSAPISLDDEVPRLLVPLQAAVDQLLDLVRVLRCGTGEHGVAAVRTARPAKDSNHAAVCQFVSALGALTLVFATPATRQVPYNAGPMSAFRPTGDELTCDGVTLAAIAASVGTPTYVYSAATLRERIAALRSGFGEYPHALHYALKANSNLAVVRVVRAAGGLVDANSGAEIEVALRAGYGPGDIVFTGVGKTPMEIDQAVALGVKTINAESAGELERIAAAACARGTVAQVALRVNPDIASESHPHISTGLGTHKFGVPITEARAIVRDASARPGLRFVGLHVHIGSQMLGLAPLRRAAAAVMGLARELRDDGVSVEHLDLGGGLGIAYEGETVPSATMYTAALVDVVRPSGLTLIVEPGRAVVGPAGALLASVVDVKPRGNGTRFVVLDAGMSELLRPALYGAYHRIEAVTGRAGVPVTCDVVGPICETADVFGVGRSLPEPTVGTVVAVLDAGAYGSAMSSNYNRHALPAEVMVDDGAWRLVRRRQTIDEQLVCEEE